MDENIALEKLLTLFDEADEWQSELQQLCSLEAALGEACRVNTLPSDEYAPALYAIQAKTDRLLENMSGSLEKVSLFLRQKDIASMKQHN